MPGMLYYLGDPYYSQTPVTVHVRIFQYVGLAIVSFIMLFVIFFNYEFRPIIL